MAALKSYWNSNRIVSLIVNYFQAQFILSFFFPAQDILAVGYGEFVFSEQKGGLACCWSLKNPEVTITGSARDNSTIVHIPIGLS